MAHIAASAAVLTLAVVGIAGFHSPAGAADVNADVSIGVRIGTPPPPPPPVVVVTPPPPAVVVIEPGVPVYFYEGRYYAYHNGAWFAAHRHEGPWVYVVAERVPPRVIAIPRAYQKLPHGHAKKLGPPPWAHAERGPKHERWQDRD